MGRQPYYAVPSKFIYRESMPMTSNGKIDKRALLASVGIGSSSATSKTNTPEPPKQPEVAGVFSDKFQMVPASPSTMSGPGSFISDSFEKFAVPPKKGYHGVRALRHRILSLYRRLFSLVFIANTIAVVLMVTSRAEGKGLRNISTAVAANLTMAILMRQEHVINLLFTISCSVPTSWPMWIRRNCAKVYHIGGIHSGCAVASTLWLVAFTVGATVDRQSPAVLVVSYLLVVLLVSMAASAHPALRAKYHNRFEIVHRFAGWTSLILFWAQTIVVTNSFRGNRSLGSALVLSPGFWLLVTGSTSVIIPWINLRKVDVRCDVLSPHAVRMYFKYTNPVVGTAIRLSERPLVEWHAFATIAKPGDKEFSLIVSKAGDWTSRQIEEPPTKICKL
jgi:hypothetical protein